MKTVSVIIPVYNAADSVGKAVESLVGQEYDGLEIILVDDGSKDGSDLVCDELGGRYEIVRVLHKANGGVSSARNAGLDAATGDYVMFLDADDVISSGSLAEMAATDADLVVGGFRKLVDGIETEVYVPLSERSYSGAEEVSVFLDDVIAEKDCYLLNSSCFKLYRRTLIEDHALRFDEALRYGEDKLFVFSFLRFVNAVRTYPGLVYDYMIGAESLSSDVTSDAHVSQIILLLERYVIILASLCQIYPDSMRLEGLYHIDVVSRYIFRILTCFATRKSGLMSMDVIADLYAYMRKDDNLGISSVRLGQIPNFLLYKLGSPGFTERFYSFSSSICKYIFLR